MPRENIPRWMTQQTVSIGAASANQISVVSPDDLNMASQMYGSFSKEMFGLANLLGEKLNFIHLDYEKMRTTEAYRDGSEAIRKLRYDPNASKDAKSFMKASSGILDDAGKQVGGLTGNVLKGMLYKEALETSFHITDSQINNTAAEIKKHQHDEWDDKNTLYLSKVDNMWSPEQKEEFITKVGQERRKTIHGMSEEQHQVLDSEFKKDYEAAELANQLFRNNSFAIPKIRDRILSSKGFSNLKNDPEKLQKVNKLIGKGLQIYNSKAIFDDGVQSAAVTYAFNNFRSKYDNIQDPVKKREFYMQEREKSKDFDVPYQKKLKDLGYMEGYELKSGNNSYIESKEAKAKNELYYRMGLNKEKDLSEIMVLEKSGVIDKSQLSAFQSGARMRIKAYDEYDKQFIAEVKSEFEINLQPSKGRNASFMENFLPKDPVTTELKKYILEQKASLVGLKDDEYKKGLSDIIARAKQKKMEMTQQKQVAYKNQNESDILVNDYGTE